MQNVLIAEGCRIEKVRIEHSVIGLRSQVKDGTVIKDTVLMGADYYDQKNNRYPIGIGENCSIEGAIIDKNVHMGDNVVIKPFPRGTNFDNDLYSVRDGIVVIPKRTVLPAGIYISPER